MSASKIIIIGAGAAGIACATKLLSYGFQDVTILEAEPRIGGRIHTISYGDNIIDLGAQWCHGERHNVVYELVKDLNLLETSAEIMETYMLARSNGEVVSKKLAERLLALCKELKERREKSETSELENASSFYSHEFEQMLNLAENKDIDRTIAAEFLRNFEKTENSFEGTNTLAELSATEDDDYEVCLGDQMLNWRDKGYKTLLRILMRSQNSNNKYGILQDRLKFDTTVERILWAEPEHEGKLLIKTKQGEEFKADHVIVTVSLGVLKAQHMHLFEPMLPAQKINAIEAINFGTVNKIFIEFAEKFWPDNWWGFALLWLQEDLNQIRGTKRAWLEDIEGFFCLNYQPRVLVAWISGAGARHMETLDVIEKLSGCLEVLQKFLPWHIPTPVNFKVTAWSISEHFKGSYSYHSMKTKELGFKSCDLAYPLMADEVLRLQFAGEATSTQHYSTVHGAVETGWREASRLAEFYGMQLKD